MRRFIAGASCPKCNESECLYFETTEPDDRVHCTRCDYTSLRGEAPSQESHTQEEPVPAEDKENSIKWH